MWELPAYLEWLRAKFALKRPQLLLKPPMHRLLMRARMDVVDEFRFLKERPCDTW